jgi:hypothetical protein
LDNLYGGQGGISKLQFLIKKYQKNFQLNFFYLWSLKPWIRIRIGIQPKTLDPDPDALNLDPKHCFIYCAVQQQRIQYQKLSFLAALFVPLIALQQQRTSIAVVFHQTY